MTYSKIWRRSKEFQPAAVGSTETKALFAVKEGWRVLSCSARVLQNSAATTDSTMTVGDGSDVDGFLVATTDLDLETSTGIVNGAGAYLATSGGKLYAADDTVDVVYTAGTTPGATNPKVRFTLTFTKDEN